MLSSHGSNIHIATLHLECFSFKMNDIRKYFIFFFYLNINFDCMNTFYVAGSF